MFFAGFNNCDLKIVNGHPWKKKVVRTKKRCLDSKEGVRKYVEELLEAMSAAAGVEERERTLQAAVPGA